MKTVVVALLLLLAIWGTFASHRLWSAKRPWSRNVWLFLACVILAVGGAATSAIGLLVDRFDPLMLLPVGVSYLLMLPLPCYFKWITATRRRHTVRNVLFVLFAAALIMLGLRILPLSLIGL